MEIKEKISIFWHFKSQTNRRSVIRSENTNYATTEPARSPLSFSGLALEKKEPHLIY